MSGPGFGKLGLASGAARSPGEAGSKSPRNAEVKEVGPKVIEVLLKRERGKYKAKWRGCEEQPTYEIWFLMDFFNDLQRYYKKHGKRRLRIIDKDEIIDIKIGENIVFAKFQFLQHKTREVM